MGSLLLSFDLGTTSGKTCLYEVGEQLVLRAAATRALGLRIDSDGTAEQEPEDWWRALADSVPEVLALAGARPQDVAGITFCAQMQCLVLVDRAGRAVRPALSYLDQRPTARMAQLTRGGPRIAGIGAALLVPWLRIAGGIAASAKDPLWKYLRVADEEPDAFARVHRWLDAKDYLTARCTGEFTMSVDCAFATFLADTRGGRCRWSPWLVRRFGVDRGHLPRIVGLSQEVGGLTAGAAAELGLRAGTPVFAGGGDASLIGVGAGATALGATHIYVGTSGWVSTVADRRVVDTRTMMATVPGAHPGRYNYFGEQETSGKCLEWVRDHLALDEIGLFLDAAPRPIGLDQQYASLLDYLTATIAEVPPGSGGVLFAPWLHGSRSPFEDPNVRGMFLNIGLDTGKRQLIRAVVEGIAYNKRLLLEAQARKVTPSEVLRFAGGGAVCDVTAQILADVTGHPVEAVADATYAGAAGAALVAAWGAGWFASLDEAARSVDVRARFVPDAATHAVHERNFAVFAELYPATKDLFARLNGP
ncbi:MAG: FGGY-family carbohydrate kinase [Candidatus Nanopelagicales bacterium]